MNNLYLLTQDSNSGYDTYDSVVVSAPDEESAKEIHPGGYDKYKQYWGNDWVRYEDRNDVIDVEFLGKTKKPTGVILASFNAG